MPAKIYNNLSVIPPFRKILNKIILSKIPSQITIPEGTLLLDQTDVAVSASLALGVFENTEIDLFRKCLKRGFSVVDIGANIGYYTVIAAKSVGPEGKVFSYEPENINHSFLEKNIKANNFSNVTALKIGLSDKKGSNKLYLDKNNKGRHTLAYEKNKECLTIDTDTLDNSLKKYGSPKIDLIKIDIEGAEFMALEGMKETINRSPELILFTELYPKAMERLGGNALAYLDDLKGLGFSLSVIDEDTKQVTPIKDIGQFMRDFPKGESFKNILAVKTALYK